MHKNRITHHGANARAFLEVKYLLEWIFDNLFDQSFFELNFIAKLVLNDTLLRYRIDDIPVLEYYPFHFVHHNRSGTLRSLDASYENRITQVFNINFDDKKKFLKRNR